jgi:hypothetical protein
MKCDEVFGCHNCREKMIMLRAQILQFRDVLKRANQEADAIDRFIQDIASTDEK